VSQAAAAQLKLFNVRAPVKRVLLLVPVALALWGAWSAARWYMGNTFAEFAPGVEEGGVETARRAIELAPSDPLTYVSAANLEKRTLDPSRLQEAVRLYEEAVRRSPNDYRMWLGLGSGREQAGDTAGGEKALRKAVELAPAYAAPRWHLGNLLLRAGRTDEAFTELRRAADINPIQFRGQVFTLAWNIYGEDVKTMQRVLGDNAATRAQLAAFLAAREKSAEAVELWTGLSASEKKEHRKMGEDLMKALYEKKQYRAAQELARDLELESADGVGQIANPGFENVIGAPGTSLFGWQLSPLQQTEITVVASQRHAGNRSLRITFNGYSRANFYNVSQLIVVEPNTRYRFEGYVRTQDLKSGGTPLIEAANVLDNKVLGTSQPFPVGRNDWYPVTFEFSTPEKTEAIYLRTNRAFCGDVCPIFGIIWYDDFNLQRLGQGGAGGQGGADHRPAQTAR
jgi:Flp pilus assembly protein TadD, contains TPR repeats